MFSGHLVKRPFHSSSVRDKTDQICIQDIPVGCNFTSPDQYTASKISFVVNKNYSVTLSTVKDHKTK